MDEDATEIEHCCLAGRHRCTAQRLGAKLHQTALTVNATDP